MKTKDYDEIKVMADKKEKEKVKGVIFSEGGDATKAESFIGFLNDENRGLCLIKKSKNSDDIKLFPLTDEQVRKLFIAFQSCKLN